MTQPTQREAKATLYGMVFGFLISSLIWYLMFSVPDFAMAEAEAIAAQKYDPRANRSPREIREQCKEYR